MKKLTLTFLSVFTLLLLAACGSSNAVEPETTAAAVDSAQVFTVSAIPDFDQAELTRNFDSFAEYLSDEIGMPVEYVPVQDYASAVTGFVRGDIDLVWFGAVTAVQAIDQVPEAESIAQRPEDAQFTSVFIKQKGLAIDSLEDLAGHTFAFGSESSTSGHLMPRYYMQAAGLDLEDFSSDPLYTGSHDRTVEVVEAGALNSVYWEQLVNENKVDMTKVEAFYETPEYNNYSWVIGDVDAKFAVGTKEAVKEALLSISAEDTEIMALLDTDKFIPSNNKSYGTIAEIAKELGVIE